MSQVPTATNTIINTNVLNYGDGSGGTGVCNTKLKIHSKMLSNEICYSNVTPLHCTPGPQAIAPVINTTIQHGVSTGDNITDGGVGNGGGGQVFHVIPLQLGNVATVINMSQNINELPITIITKNNTTIGQHHHHNQQQQQPPNNFTLHEIDDEIITTLPAVNKNNSKNILTAGNIEITKTFNGNSTPRNLMNIKNKDSNVQQSNNSVIHSPKAILIPNQHQQSANAASSTTPTLKRILPKAVANVSVIQSSPSIETKNVKPIVINGQHSNLPARNKPNFAIQKNIDNNNKLISVAALKKDIALKLQNKMLTTITPTNPPVPVAISMVESSSTFANKMELIEKSGTALLSSGSTTTIVPTIISENSNEYNAEEDIEKSETVLVIDASTDEETEPEDSDIDDDYNQNPMSVTHISNSVVLTKAKAVDSRTNGNSRNMSQEPASVVIMTLPNARQQMLNGAAASTSNIAIPIKDALSIAAAANNENVNKMESAFKVVPTVKLLQKPLCKNERPSVLMRSNSIPQPQKCVSPRATKRSQSLTCNQTATETVRLEPFKFENSNNASETSSNQQRRYSNSNSNSNHCDDSENLLVPLNETNHDNSPHNESFSSTDELNKENNEITFIELDDDDDDSFVESNSEESNSEKPKINLEAKPTATTSEEKEKNQQQYKDILNIIDIQNGRTPSNMIMNIADACEQVGVSIMKDKNDNSKSKSLTSPKRLPLNGKATAESPKSSTQVPVSHQNSNSNEENDDQIIKSLLCNEQINNVTPSTSSSPASCPKTTPKISEIIAKKLNSQRPTQPARRAPGESNNLAVRRVCRDSSVAAALSMVSTFDMLNWKEDRIATARGTAMRFELNEFNLLQLHERGCPPRYRIHTPYERPIIERISAVKKTEQLEPLLYMCRKCKQHGPAIDFLAPEYCSLECLKRNSTKRNARKPDSKDVVAFKRARKSLPNEGNNKILPNNYQGTKFPQFRWTSYLSTLRNAVAAPIDLFLNPFPTGPNPFRLGMKLEAIDPENCSLFCVCTVVRIQGYRLRLTFDGYESIYDFWVNADSMEIFPPGWCASTHRLLQPPRGYDPHKFEWETYLKKTNSIPADKKLFTHLIGTSMTDRNPFTIGMFLEADDLNDTGKLCVASVGDVLGERIRVHFDGWDDCYDYWVDINSPYIHPCGWHEGRQQLLVPPEYGNTSFNWRDYIKESKTGIAAPADFFTMREAIDYRPGMKLEVVDPRNASLIRPATVVHRTRHRIKIHLDCWPAEYTFSLEDDSPDLHPMGWCDATGHALEPPPGYQQYPQVMPCGTAGCRGIGNVDPNKARSHAIREHCPYALENWRTKFERTPRVDGKVIVRNLRVAGSVLRTYKRQHNQIVGGNTETPKLIEKPNVQMPFKQSTRGRPRNCDRVAAQQQRPQEYQQRFHQHLQQQRKQQQQHPMERRHHSLDMKAFKQENGIDQHINVKIKIEPDTSNDKSTPSIPSPSSASTATTTPTPTSAPAPPPTPTSSPPTNVNFDPKISIATRFLCDYGPRLQQNYELWRQNISVNIAAKVQRNPLLWSTAETCAFVDAVLSEGAENAARYTVSSKFYKHDIDGAALLMLQQQDLTELLQLKMGPAVKLCGIILQLRMLVISKYDFKTKQPQETATADNNLLKN